jgi:TonB family protein
MKIVCDACSAKYSIADDKVKGKVFKIRCKKCSNIIVVRGGAGGAEEPAPAQFDQKETRVFDYNQEPGYDEGAAGGDESVWHVVIDQEQVGPLTVAEVQQRFASGQIDAETFVWREGFADWQPLSQVDVFAALAVSGNTTTAQPGSRQDAVAAMFGAAVGDETGTVRSDPNDLFGARAAPRDVAEDDDGGALFGGGGRAAAAAPEPAAAAGSRLKGERNENSVLFSLNNLAKLASDSPKPAAASSAGGAAPAAGGAPAGGEGSGLIDIRSMATAYMGERGSSKQTGASSAIGSVDDLPVFASSGFAEPAVIVPTGGSRGGNQKLMYGLIAAGGAVAVALVVLIIILLSGGDDKKGTQVAQADTPSTKPTGETGDKPAGETGDKPTGETGDKPSGETGDKPSGETGDKPSGETGDKPSGETGDKPSGGDKPSSGDTGSKPSSGGTKPTGDTGSKPRGGSTSSSGSSGSRDKPSTGGSTGSTGSKPAGGDDGGCDEVSCILAGNAGACCAKYAKKGGGTKPSGGSTTGGGKDPNLPETLDRAAIQDGVNKVKGRVTACGTQHKARGEVKVSVKVSPSGSVTSATVKSSPDAGLGSCVASAMSKASFKKTQNGGSFAYPWKF